MAKTIRQYFVTRFGASEVEKLAEEDSLLDAGLIDSVSMIELISHLEKEFEIRVDEDDMIPENFDSISAISRYVDSKKGR